MADDAGRARDRGAATVMKPLMSHLRRVHLLAFLLILILALEAAKALGGAVIHRRFERSHARLKASMLLGRTIRDEGYSLGVVPIELIRIQAMLNHSERCFPYSESE